MKILMPFKVHDGKSIDDAKVMGGLERFAQLLYKTFDGRDGRAEIIPCMITSENRRRGNANELIRAAASRKSSGLFEFDQSTATDIDVILTNYEEDTYTTKLIMPGGPPVVWIYHTGQDGTFGRVKATRLFKKFTDAGGHLYFVSKHQHNLYDELSNRIMGHPVEGVRGYINPAFCEGFEAYNSNPPEYDVVTIGRTSYIKDPFWIHNKLKDSTLSGAVITTGGHHLSSNNEQKYYQANLNWQSPRTVFRDLPHKQGLEIMSRGSVFVSTWPLETWGITALEALSHGLPTILLTDKSGRHASEAISADPSHVRCLAKTATKEEFEAVVNELKLYSQEKRREIATMTQVKHSKQAFIDRFTGIFNDAKSGVIQPQSCQTT
jgi:glycosyltransferase involved in cell wall biosynthesis